MCGGGSDRAARQAAAMEAQRKAEIARGTDLIDQAFAARQPQYGDFVSALREHYTSDAERQKEVADRQLRFSMARGGLTGGSAQTDANTNLGREFSEGLLGAERQAQVGLADLMSRDDASRMNLLALVQGGAGAATAAQQAGTAMRSNIQGAKAAGLASGLGDIFGGTADLYKQQQEAAARRRGLKEAEIYANPFSRGDG
jgi:hypothetical protein